MKSTLDAAHGIWRRSGSLRTRVVRKPPLAPQIGVHPRSITSGGETAIEEHIVRAPEILQLPAMPMGSPSYAPGPCRFVDCDRVWRRNDARPNRHLRFTRSHELDRD
jgi:hypothetical protein